MYLDSLLKSRVPNYPEGQLGSQSKNLSGQQRAFYQWQWPPGEALEYQCWPDQYWFSFNSSNNHHRVPASVHLCPFVSTDIGNDIDTQCTKIQQNAKKNLLKVFPCSSTPAHSSILCYQKKSKGFWVKSATDSQTHFPAATTSYSPVTPPQSSSPFCRKMRKTNSNRGISQTWPYPCTVTHGCLSMFLEWILTHQHPNKTKNRLK